MNGDWWYPGGADWDEIGREEGIDGSNSTK